MNDEIILNSAKKPFSDIQMLFCGHQKCAPGHAFGPGMHGSYILHLVLSGQGFYQTDLAEYHLCKNQLFLILPNERIYYHADEKDPWEYVWIAIEGEDAPSFLQQCGLSREAPVATLDNTTAVAYSIYEMIRCKQVGYAEELKLRGLLYQCLASLAAQLCEPDSRARDHSYAERAIQYIRYNFYKDISIGGIADYLSLNRCYFSELFKRCVGVPPGEFLLAFRIAQAEELLKSTNLTIYEIAASCGFNEPASFSKAFKRRRGQSPTELKAHLTGKRQKGKESISTEK